MNSIIKILFKKVIILAFLILSLSCSSNNNEYKEKIDNIFVNTIDKVIKTDSNINNPNEETIILIQGFAEPSWLSMASIYIHLKERNFSVYPINLFPNFGDINKQSELLNYRIKELQKSGKINQKISFICHSMGGLVVRDYINKFDGNHNVNKYVSISTPHYGTYMAYTSFGKAAEQMRPNSPFLKKLNKTQTKNYIDYYSIWTITDEIVVPSNNSVLKNSNELKPIYGADHFIILWRPQTIKQILSIFE